MNKPENNQKTTRKIYLMILLTYIIFVLLIMKTCSLSLVRAFRKNLYLEKRKEKGAISPKIKQFMPKISEIVLKKEKN